MGVAARAGGHDSDEAAISRKSARHDSKRIAIRALKVAGFKGAWPCRRGAGFKGSSSRQLSRMIYGRLHAHSIRRINSHLRQPQSPTLQRSQPRSVCEIAIRTNWSRISMTLTTICVRSSKSITTLCPGRRLNCICSRRSRRSKLIVVFVKAAKVTRQLFDPGKCTSNRRDAGARASRRTDDRERSQSMQRS